MFQDISSYDLLDLKDDYDSIELLRLYKVSQRLKDLMKSNKLSEQIKKKMLQPYYKRELIHRLRYELKDLTRPEESYEIWHQYPHLSKYKSYSYSTGDFYDETYLVSLIKTIINDRDKDRKERVDKIEQDEEDEESEEEIQHEERLDISEKTRERMNSTRRLEKKYLSFMDPKNSSNELVKIEFLLRTSGLEIMPTTRRGQRYYKYHVHNLTFFLHMTVLNEKWDLAYKIFCIILRIPSLDLRMIWSIGIDILRGKTQLLESSNPGNTDVITTVRFLQLKQQRFFTWLDSFYLLNIRKPLHQIVNPIFQSGSKSHVPIYFITSLWSLIADNEYKKVIDILDGVILRSPYDIEGCLPFILSLSYLMENTRLISTYENIGKKRHLRDPKDDQIASFGDRSEVYSKISENFLNIEKNLSKCESLKFDYPRDLIDEQISFISRKLQEIDNNYTYEEDDDEEEDEDEDEDPLDSLLENHDKTRVIEQPESQNRSQVSIESFQIPSDEEMKFSDDEEPTVEPSKIPSDEEMEFSDEEEMPKVSQIPSDEEIEFSDIEDLAVKPSQIPSDEEIIFSDDDEEEEVNEIQVPQSSQIQTDIEFKIASDEELEFEFSDDD